MKHYHCPVNGWDCPYYKKEKEIGGKIETGVCDMEDPYNECDDFYTVYGDTEDTNDYTDYGD